MFKKLLKLTLMLGVLLGLFACSSLPTEEDSSNSVKSSVKFTMQNIGATNSNILFSAIDDQTPSKVAISYKKSEEGEEEISTTIELTAFGNSYITDDVLSLYEGNYELTKFDVLNDTGATIYSTPVAGSEVATNLNISTALAYNFEVKEGEISTEKMQVVAVSDTTDPADFGHAAFTFELVDYNKFYVEVLVLDDSLGWVYTTAQVEVKNAKGSNIKTASIDGKMNKVIVANSESYTITISKDGYASQEFSSNKDDLAKYENEAMVVKLKKAKGKTISFEVKNTENSFLDAVATTTNSKEVVVSVDTITEENNTIFIANDDDYTLTISKEGYTPQTFSYSKDELSSGNDETLKIELEEEGVDDADITNSLGMEFVLVGKGTFMMGDDNTASWDARPVHEVTLTKDYYIGKYEVTQAQWVAVMGSNPSYNKGDNLPVENVSWYEVQEFISKLNQMEGTDKYSLPTEAEWEFAARGGNKSQGYTYAGSNNIDEVACYSESITGTTQQVGTKKANELGIYDMSGNVWEWCSDWCDDYSSESQIDPTGARSGFDDERVVRGGCYCHGTTVASRLPREPNHRGLICGFRIARSIGVISFNNFYIEVMNSDGTNWNYTNANLNIVNEKGTSIYSNNISGEMNKIVVSTEDLYKITISKYGYVSQTFNFTKDSLANYKTTALKVHLEKKENEVGTFTGSTYTNSMGMEFVLVEAGTFSMGSNDGYDNNEKPVHEVTLTKDYYIGKYEVTQKQWIAVMGSNPSNHQGDNLPVTDVSWNDVQEFITKLNQIEETDKYSLPTEAQWEFAARGGNISEGYPYYAGSYNLDEVAWYDRNSSNQIHQVGTKKANELGIYDMSGNVFEWCSDLYGAYGSVAVSDPIGASSGSDRMLRGGYWSHKEFCCHVANRCYCNPSYHSDYTGFRLVSSMEVLFYVEALNNVDDSGWDYTNAIVTVTNPNGAIIKIDTITGNMNKISVPVEDSYTITVSKDGYVSQAFSYNKSELGAETCLSVKLKFDTSFIDSINFVLVEAGTFMMGSDDKSWTRPVHEVTLTKDYYIGKYEVTQKQWVAVMGSNPSYFKGENLPVENITWYDAQEFITKINKIMGTDKYRLPTEAEWEFAARGGNKSQGYIYAGSNNIDEVAWYRGNSNNKTHQVGTKKANELGIYDMTGNVLEWCSDLWSDNYGSSEAVTDPMGASSGIYRINRIIRGGSWNYANDFLVVHRYGDNPENESCSIGLRLARSK